MPKLIQTFRRTKKNQTAGHKKPTTTTTYPKTKKIQKSSIFSLLSNSSNRDKKNQEKNLCGPKPEPEFEINA